MYFSKKSVTEDEYAGRISIQKHYPSSYKIKKNIKEQAQYKLAWSTTELMRSAYLTAKFNDMHLAGAIA